MPATKTLFCTLLAGFALPWLAPSASAQHLSVQEVPLTANHVLYDSFNQKVYASIPGSAALHPNTVAQINATSHVVEAYIPVGSEPDVLALSSDGQYLYVGTDGTSGVARLVLATNTVDQQFSLGTAPLAPQYIYHAGNIIPLPGMPQSVAVTRDYFGISPPTDGVAVFDSGVQRSTILRRGQSTYGALTGSSSPDRIYAYDNETTSFSFDQLNLDANGITGGQNSDSFGTGILSGFNATIKFDKGNGLVYATNGTVVDPVALTDVGTYPNINFSNTFSVSVVDVVPRASENRVYFLVGATNRSYSGTATIAVYDQTAFQRLSTNTTSATFTDTGDLSEISPTSFVFRSDRGVEFATPQAISSIVVTAASPTVAAGKTDQFTAMAAYPDGATSNVTSTVTWSSSNTAAAAITASGLATGVTPGTASITASLNSITSTPVTIRVTAAPAHILWSNLDGRISVWNLSDADPAATCRVFGPYPGWTAKAIAEGPDGNARLLWDNVNGRIAIWSLADANPAATCATYGPYGGWAGKSLTVGADNAAHLLWDNSDGRVSLWNLADANPVANALIYGPYSGWSGTAIAIGPDSKERLLWNSTGGQASVWNLADFQPDQTCFIAGPYGGWTVTALAVGPDNAAHLLWDNVSGPVSLWNLADARPDQTCLIVGPYAGWSGTAIAFGADNKERLLWDNSAGPMSLWNLADPSPAASSLIYGPFGGWTAIGVSAR